MIGDPLPSYRTVSYEVNENGKRICRTKLDAVNALSDAYQACAAVKAWATNGYMIGGDELHERMRDPKYLLRELLVQFNVDPAE